ncbi:MAG TPA: CHASE sensor domain-containing protein [Bryobacteraceae bacterium]|nr:CHASE sensor domain-containing protein [Bryobacteraceae bacterium]
MRIKARYRNLSTKRKLQLIIMVTSGLALMVASSGTMAYSYLSSVEDTQHELAVLADTIGANSTAALSFHDKDAAAELLNGFKANHAITSAILYTADGAAFASYSRDGTPGASPPQSATGTWREGGRIKIVRSIRLDRQSIGAIYLESDFEELAARLKRLGVFVAAILCGFVFLLRANVPVSAHHIRTDPGPGRDRQAGIPRKGLHCSRKKNGRR